MSRRPRVRHPRQEDPCPVVPDAPPTAPPGLRAAVRPAWLLAGALLAIATGCRREEVATYRVAKAGPPPAGEAAADPMGSSHRPAPPPPAPPPGMAGDVPLPPTPSGAEALQWTLPK